MPAGLPGKPRCKEPCTGACPLPARGAEAPQGLGQPRPPQQIRGAQEGKMEEGEECCRGSVLLGAVGRSARIRG